MVKGSMSPPGRISTRQRPAPLGTTSPEAPPSTRILGGSELVGLPSSRVRASIWNGAPCTTGLLETTASSVGAAEATPINTAASAIGPIRPRQPHDDWRGAVSPHCFSPHPLATRHITDPDRDRIYALRQTHFNGKPSVFIGTNLHRLRAFSNRDGGERIRHAVDVDAREARDLRLGAGPHRGAGYR